MASERSHVLVAAIDFGTTFSGYAFSTNSDYQLNPLNISSLVWTASSGNFQSLKTSTCILFDPKGNFNSFGFEAEDYYSDLAADDEHEDWYFFKRFKMKLYNQVQIDRTFEITSFNGKKMSALKIFSSAIAYLKGQLMKECTKQGAPVGDADILWILTVPAIWSEPAKQFMREAAAEASIPNDQLKLVLEPEAAAVYCNHLPLDRVKTGENDKMAAFKPGSKYLVLDAGESPAYGVYISQLIRYARACSSYDDFISRGRSLTAKLMTKGCTKDKLKLYGGTIDITVQEVQGNGKLKEIHKATGGDWGGTSVDGEFKKMLEEIAGTESFEDYKKENVADWLTLNRNFEVKKREDIPENLVTFRMPYSLMQNIKQKHPQEETLSGDIQLKMDKIRVPSNKMKSFFQKSLTNIINHICTLMKHAVVKDIVAILMVGGYSECTLLQNEVKSKFPNLKVIIPNEAGLCVLKGAVIYGHEPTIITERKCRMTYGLAVSSKFRPGIDSEEKRIKGAKGDDRCFDVFKVFVKTDDTVTIGTPTSPHTFKVGSENATGIDLPVYATPETSPRYVTDETCQKLGMLKIEIPDTSRGADRGVKVQMIFGGTEIEVMAIDIHTGEEHKSHFKFVN